MGVFKLSKKNSDDGCVIVLLHVDLCVVSTICVTSIGSLLVLNYLFFIYKLIKWLLCSAVSA